MVPAPWHASDQPRSARRRWQVAFYVAADRRLRRLRGLDHPRRPPRARLQPAARRLPQQPRLHAQRRPVPDPGPRRPHAYRPAWRVLGVGLALYGLRQHLLDDLHPDRWTRSRSRPSRTPCGCRSTRIAFVALLLIVREMAPNGVPLSLWLDGIVGGLAVAAVDGRRRRPGPRGRPAAARPPSSPRWPTRSLDVLLLLIVTALLALFHWRPPLGLWFLAGGLAVFAVADVWYCLVGRATARTSRAVSTTRSGCSPRCSMGFAPGWSKQAVGRVAAGVVAAGHPGAAPRWCAVALLVYDHAHDAAPDRRRRSPPPPSSPRSAD